MTPDNIRIEEQLEHLEHRMLDNEDHAATIRWLIADKRQQLAEQEPESEMVWELCEGDHRCRFGRHYVSIAEPMEHLVPREEAND